MILKGSQRAGGVQLAAHLLNMRENDHVRVVQVRGFIADDLRGAFGEAHHVAKATQCKQYLFSLSLNPPAASCLSDEAFLLAAERAEAALGLSGQPRAVVIHEKEGRRHAHVVWSRIDPIQMKAVNLPHFKSRLSRLSKELFLEHGWSLPEGFSARTKSPLNFTLSEWQQAKRLDLDPREVKAMVQEAWSQSDGQAAFARALEGRGFTLARGDRRGLVAVDVTGEVYSLTRALGLKVKDVASRIGDPSSLPSVAEAKDTLRAHAGVQMLRHIGEVRARHAAQREPLVQERSQMAERQRAERARQAAGLEARAQREARARNDQLRRGLAGLFDWLSGRAQQVRRMLEQEAVEAMRRDRALRDQLVLEHLSERRALQERLDALRQQQSAERRVLMTTIGAALSRLRLRAHRAEEHSQDLAPERAGNRDRRPSITWPRDPGSAGRTRPSDQFGQAGERYRPPPDLSHS